jgi:hypothetical protein
MFQGKTETFPDEFHTGNASGREEREVPTAR